VNIRAGQSSALVTVKPNSDTLEEPDEKVVLWPLATDQYDTIVPVNATVTIEW